jgi:hypothetical protein
MVLLLLFWQSDDGAGGSNGKGRDAILRALIFRITRHPA